MLTHGDSVPLKETLDSFYTMVRPAPVDGFMLVSGGDKPDVKWPFTVAQTGKNVGFCQATRIAWALAGKLGVDWVYWLEHDFLHTRLVDLSVLASILRYNKHLAQMSLMRNPENEEERRAGSHVRLHPENYERRGNGNGQWLEHSVCWTTNPSLFSRKVAVRFPWPDGPWCEGKMAFDMRKLEPGVRFGIWGDGEQWVEHVGTRTGHGY